MSESLDPDARLNAYLEHLDARLHDLMECSFVGDPDDVAEQLSLDTAFVADSIDTVLAAVESASRKLTDLNDVVDHASREFLLTGDHGVAIKTTKDPLLVGLPHSFELLFAVVLRTLQIANECGGETTEINLHTHTSGYRDSFDVRARFQWRNHAQRPAEERVVSLRDLLDGMGGNVTVEQGDDCLILSLAFETRTSSV